MIPNTPPRGYTNTLKYIIIWEHTPHYYQKHNEAVSSCDQDPWYYSSSEDEIACTTEGKEPPGSTQGNLKGGTEA